MAANLRLVQNERGWLVGKLARALFVLAVILIAGGWIYGVMQSRRAIEASPAPTPAEIMHLVSDGEWITMAGVAVGAVGAMELLLSMAAQRRRQGDDADEEWDA